MARCKNVGGSPLGGDEGDRGDSPPRIIEVARGKRKLISRKKRTRKERDRGSPSSCRGSGILIGESRTRVSLSGRVLGTEATEATEDQPEEPAEQEQQTPPIRCSRRTTHSQTTPAASPERPRREGRLAPRSQVIHYDLRKALARQIQTFHKVQLHEWFPLQRQPGVDHFCTAL
jgi:hypothetical protein